MRIIAQETLCPYCHYLNWRYFPEDLMVEVTCPECGQTISLVHYQPEAGSIGEWVPVLETVEEIEGYSNAMKKIPFSRRVAVINKELAAGPE